MYLLTSLSVLVYPLTLPRVSVFITCVCVCVAVPGASLCCLSSPRPWKSPLEPPHHRRVARHRSVLKQIQGAFRVPFPHFTREITTDWTIGVIGVIGDQSRRVTCPFITLTAPAASHNRVFQCFKSLKKKKENCLKVFDSSLVSYFPVICLVPITEISRHGRQHS